MLSFFTGGDKKARGRHEELKKGARLKNAKELFFSGKFPVVTTPVLDGRKIRKVLGLVSGRGFDSECAFYGLTASALDIGADAIIGYQENVAFHPDGSRYFSCYGTAVILEREQPAQAATTRKTVGAKSLMH
ncbi:hypothetical protein DFW101_0495 [Solidesulfovibrio carbinoliphilus subsp. oakridgensis]|uniref:Uncharacterized protein n=1 Tax=Solidesulfovibrio carbinoliphilus subsp. oakridgensis TaxID=694327 RepID=G7QDK6_9BACT|nr:hypothetical protein [Solidesulfovibrio carbinoliphilus]EHJ46512.1 hypothetical protein DFW101_0495 [Solidesulfovibrio carbinoliphilus subsp. oakridgensis]